MTLPSIRTSTEKLDAIAIEVTDVDEETYSLFSHALPSTNLGMVDAKSSMITIEVAGNTYEIRQSPGLLTSSNSEGTTGAALWKISPLIAEWLADRDNALRTTSILHAQATVIELGCGITGLIGLALSRLVATYILTDQKSVLKLLQENIRTNLSSLNRDKNASRSSQKHKASSRNNPDVRAIELNWETDGIDVLNDALPVDQSIDLVVVCDCVFNDFLLEPLVTMCTKLCSRHRETPTILLIAQQLRSDEVFSAFLTILSRSFRVWRFSDNYLPDSLQEGTGFATHVAVLK
ncbi:Ribosomal protein lysine methyltransferase [Lithohypha guttulata]|uniref:Ribosomal protein lysine methyltransferase n=1 Tax=Lithohypha guttulata TaxID=1690604 RepID=UPI00315D430D